MELQVMKFADRIHGKITFNDFRFPEIAPWMYDRGKCPKLVNG